MEVVIVVLLGGLVWLAMNGFIDVFGGNGAEQGTRFKLRTSALKGQFSLRAALIAVTVVAIVLGMIAISN